MSTPSSRRVSVSDNEFDDYDFSSFEENPSWLVDDIAAMMDEKKTRYKGTPVSGPASKMAKEIRALKSNLNPDKNDTYKFFCKEKTATTMSDLNEIRLRRTKLDVESHIDEQKVREFMDIIRRQNKDKIERHGEYMKRALYKPNPDTLPGLPRRWSPTRPRAQTAKIEATSPFASTAIRPLSPPKTVRPSSPTINFHEMILKEMRDRRHVDVASKVAVDVQSVLLVLVKAARYYNNLTQRARELRLVRLKFFRASKKIQRSFKRMQTQSSLERYLQVPTIFTQFLYRWKRKKALRIVVSFINDVQNCKTKRIVRRFLLAVKKVQTYFRQYLQVREARILALSILWEREERVVRRQLEETERANYVRNEKLRLKRMGKSVHSASTFEKWNLTHHQVEALYEHMNDVDVTRANVIRLNEGGGGKRPAKGGRGSSDEDQRNLFMEMCDPAMVRQAIAHHIATKRRLHLMAQLEEEDKESRQRMARLQEQQKRLAECNPLLEQEGSGVQKELTNNYINLKVVKKVMKDFSTKNTRDLLSRQLAHAGIDVEEDERAIHAQKLLSDAASSKYKVQQNTMKLENFGNNKEENREGRMFKLKTFFLLTGGPELGKSWKSYIEENVRADSQRKKKIQQDKNDASIRESMRTQQERAEQQRQLAYQAKHASHNPYGGGGSLEALSLTNSMENGDGRRKSLTGGDARHVQSAPALNQGQRRPQTVSGTAKKGAGGDSSFVTQMDSEAMGPEESGYVSSRPSTSTSSRQSTSRSALIGIQRKGVGI